VSVTEFINRSGWANRQILSFPSHQLWLLGQGMDTERFQHLFHVGRLVCRFNAPEVTILQANLLAKTPKIDHQQRGIEKYRT
jgi:hypothetical protein